jgi:hypothetical protein
MTKNKNTQNKSATSKIEKAAFEKQLFEDFFKTNNDLLLFNTFLSNTKIGNPFFTHKTQIPSESDSEEVVMVAKEWLQGAGFEMPPLTSSKQVNALLLSHSVIYIAENYLHNVDHFVEDKPRLSFKAWHSWIERRLKTIFSQISKNIEELEKSEIAVGSFVLTKEPYGKGKIYGIVKGFEPAQFLTYPVWLAKEQPSIPELFFTWRSELEIRRFFSKALQRNIVFAQKKGQKVVKLGRATVKIESKFVVKPLVSEDGSPTISHNYRRVHSNKTEQIPKDDITCAFINWITQEHIT